MSTLQRNHFPEALLASAGAAVSQRTSRTTLAATLAALACVVGGYWSTIAAMAGIWARSDTFAHGFVVAPISLWLIWRNRAQLASAGGNPSWRLLILVAAAGFGWLLGELTQINALRQFAVVALIVLAVPVIAGVDVFRRIAFPLAFLFFAVPFGEFLLPRLMEWTAIFAVAGLRATGIPVYQDGLQFVIPSGTWSVVEACSGVRYLIASVMMGTLFAYLTYRSLHRRIIFVAVSFVVPIVANWVRAYMIVLLGHLSSNKLAVGVDHLIYGWLFFGIVMLVMFWIGSRWREDEEPAGTMAAATARAPSAPGATSQRIWRSAIAFVVVAAAPLLAQQVLGGAVRGPVPELAAVTPSDGWLPSTTPVTAWRPRYVGPSAERFETLVKDGRPVGLYLGLYRNQSNARKLVSSENTLVASTDNHWFSARMGSRDWDLPEQRVSAQVSELRSSTGERLRVWQWFWVDGHLTGSDARAKAYSAWAQLRGRGDDGAVVIVVTPVSPTATARADADAALEAFTRAEAGAIGTALQATRVGR
ncbi:MAG: exosortase A [Betaproteobacteria bacterium]